MTNTQTTIPIINSIGKVAPNYDAWLCDIWGVIHNGVRPFSRADNACSRFRGGGGTVVLLTNSPRPSYAVQEQLDEIGISRDAYDAVVSSGDVARSLVSSSAGRPIYHLGPERDRGIFDGLDIRLVEPEQAEMVLCSGLFDDDTETPDDYSDLLASLRSRSLPFVCANPDIVVERGDKIVYCAGALAAAYNELAGEVIYTGKPSQSIYDLGLQRIAEIKGQAVSREQVLAIGDGLKTDMPGAFAASLDALYIASAIHVEGHNEEASLSDSAVAALFGDSRQMPIAAMSRLEW